MTIEKEEARAYILNYQGLSGAKPGAEGKNILEHIRKVGCIQYDPLNRTGRNADLVLQSRFLGYSEPLLYDLLYKERNLIDGWDKMMSLWPVEDWPLFARMRQRFTSRYRERSREFEDTRKKILSYLSGRDSLCSNDLPSPGMTDWSWAPTSLVRAVLESMYHTGELIVHHKEGTRKFYGLTERWLPDEIREASDPFPDDRDHFRWYVRRRVASQGLLWNKGGDGPWLGTPMKSTERTEAIRRALEKGEIEEISVKGISRPLYSPREAWEKRHEAKPSEGRMEFIAPLDNLIWDRNFIAELFDFDYKWEVYTPVRERKYAYYVLPVIWKDRFVARCEPVYNREERTLRLEDWWWEPGCSLTPDLRGAMGECLKNFALFLGAKKIRSSRKKKMKEFSWIRELIP